MRTTLQILVATITALIGASAAPSVAAGPSNEKDRLREQIRECRHQVASRHIDEAPAMIRSLLAKHPDNAELWMLLGACNVYQIDSLEKHHAEARRCLNKAIALDPQLGQAYFYLADLENFTGNTRAAIPLAIKATTVAKPEYGAYRICAVAYNSLGKRKEALAAINEFQRKNPSHTDSSGVTDTGEIKAGIFESMGNYSDAEKIYSDLLKVKVIDRVVAAQVRCLIKLGRTDAAIASISRLIASNPHDEVAHRERAKLYKSVGRYDDAIRDLTSSIDELPSGSTYRERAELYKKTNRIDLYRKDIAAADRI